MHLKRYLYAALIPLTLAACGGGDDDPTGPGSNAERQAAAASLTALADELAGSNPDAAVGATYGAVALDLGAPITGVTINIGGGTASVVGDAIAYTAANLALTTGTWSSTAMRIVLQNYPTAEDPDLTFTAVVAWRGTSDLIAVITEGTASSFSLGTTGETGSGFGILFSEPSASWMATAGSASFSGGSATGNCPNFPVITGFTCQIANYTGSFSITNATPTAFTGNTATGNKSASLGSTSLGGILLTVDYTSQQ